MKVVLKSCHHLLQADDVRMAIAQSIDLAAHVRGLNHVQTPADEETEMQMALAMYTSRRMCA